MGDLTVPLGILMKNVPLLFKLSFFILFYLETLVLSPMGKGSQFLKEVKGDQGF